MLFSPRWDHFARRGSICIKNFRAWSVFPAADWNVLPCNSLFEDVACVRESFLNPCMYMYGTCNTCTLIGWFYVFHVVPGPPVGILFPEVRTTSVRLIWQPPAQPNGIILGQLNTIMRPNVLLLSFRCLHRRLFGSCSAAVSLSLLSLSHWSEFASSAYQITYRRNSSNSNAATVDVLSPSARQYTATGLKPELVYVFRLTAQTRKGWGEAAEALVVTTEKRGTKTLRPKCFIQMSPL